MQDLTEKLRKLGLTRNERKVYLALLELGTNTVGPIINKLKIHRQIAYDALDGLIEKKLVDKFIRGKRFHFSVSSPENFKSEIKKKENIADEVAREVKKMIKGQKRGQEIRVYEGVKAFREYILDNDLRSPEGSTIYVVSGGAKEYLDAIGSASFKKTEKVRVKKKIITKVIIPVSVKKESEAYNRKFGEYAFIPNEFSPPTAFQVCHDSVILIAYWDEVFFIEIKNEKFRQTYINYFNMLWKLAGK